MRPRSLALAGTGVFGKQSPGPALCDPLALAGQARPRYAGCPFSRSYGANLPSSLAGVLPSTSVCSTSPPVSVCGTVAVRLARSFSRRFGFGPFGSARTPPLPVTPQVKRPGGFTYRDSLQVWRATSWPPGVPPRVSPSLERLTAGRESEPVVHRLRLPASA